MLIHTLHTSSIQKLSVPQAPGMTCPFCSRPNYRRGQACSNCGTVEPSSKSEMSAAKLMQRKGKVKKKRLPKSADYIPVCDGVNGVTAAQDNDELAPYRDELDELAVDMPDDQLEDDALLPDQDTLDSLPWD